jgi:hypothetical protein
MAKKLLLTEPLKFSPSIPAVTLVTLGATSPGHRHE